MRVPPEENGFLEAVCSIRIFTVVFKTNFMSSDLLFDLVDGFEANRKLRGFLQKHVGKYAQKRNKCVHRSIVLRM